MVTMIQRFTSRLFVPSVDVKINVSDSLEEGDLEFVQLPAVGVYYVDKISISDIQTLIGIIQRPQSFNWFQTCSISIDKYCSIGIIFHV